MAQAVNLAVEHFTSRLGKAEMLALFDEGLSIVLFSIIQLRLNRFNLLLQHKIALLLLEFRVGLFLNLMAELHSLKQVRHLLEEKIYTIFIAIAL